MFRNVCNLAVHGGYDSFLPTMCTVCGVRILFLDVYQLKIFYLATLSAAWAAACSSLAPATSHEAGLGGMLSDIVLQQGFCA